MCQYCNDLVESMIYRNWYSLGQIRKWHLRRGWEPACDFYRSQVIQYYSNMEKAWQRGRPKDKTARPRTAMRDAWHLFPLFEESGMLDALWNSWCTQASLDYDARIGWRHRHPPNPDRPFTGHNQQQVRLMD